MIAGAGSGRKPVTVVTAASAALPDGASSAGGSAPGVASDTRSVAAIRGVESPVVGLIVGSSSDWEIMRHAAAILDEFGVPYESHVISAHRMPLDMVEYGSQAYARGLRAIVAGAGGAAHLPGMMAALTPVPVFGVPVPSHYLRGADSLLSIVQMPRGVPVATFAIGESGAVNAALHAVANLAMTDGDLLLRLKAYRARQTDKARAMVLPPESA